MSRRREQKNAAKVRRAGESRPSRFNGVTYAPERDPVSKALDLMTYRMTCLGYTPQAARQAVLDDLSRRCERSAGFRHYDSPREFQEALCATERY